LVSENAEQANEYLRDVTDFLLRLLSPKVNPSKTGTRSAAATHLLAGDFGAQRVRETLFEMDQVRNLIARGDWDGARAAAARGLTIWERKRPETP